MTDKPCLNNMAAIDLYISQVLIPKAKELWGIDVPEIPIKMTVSRHKAGSFHYDHKGNPIEFRFSKNYAQDEPDFVQTVIHEFAHQVQHQMKGYSAHNSHFQCIMDMLGGEMDIYHHYGKYASKAVMVAENGKE